MTALLVPGRALAQATGSISGTVTNAANGQPISNATIVVMRLPDLSTSQSSLTNASGVYTVSGLAPGNYVAYSSNNVGFLNEVYDNRPCPGECSSTDAVSGVPIVVTAGATTAGRDFALDRGATISGTVTNAATGAAVQGVFIQALVRFGNGTRTVRLATTNASGFYTMNGLPALPIYLFTSSGGPLVDEIYDNIQCVADCTSANAVATGTPVAVTLGATTANRDFALEPGGSVSGTIINATTGAPIQNVNVAVYTRIGTSNTFAGSAATNASGAYTVSGLATATYYAATSNSVGFTNEIYDNVLCPIFCSTTTLVESGAEIPVTIGQDSPGRNFALEVGGSVSGVVTNQLTGVPVPGINVTVITRVGTSTFSTSAQTNASGVYTVAGLPTGTYWAMTNTGLNFINEIYNDIPCLGPCSTANAISSGAPIPVALGAVTGGVNFAIAPGAIVEGLVTDAVTATALSTSVQLVKQEGTALAFILGSNTNSSGAYRFQGLSPGTYFVSTTATGYRNEVYNNVPCVGISCSNAEITSGTPINVAAISVVSGINLALSPGEGITGLVTDAATGVGLGSVTVNLYDRPTGRFAASTSTNLAGFYRLPAVRNGTYVAYTTSSLGYINEIHDNIACPSTCSSATAVATGTPITVAGASADVTGINFALSPRNAPPAAPTNLRALTDGFTVRFTWSAPSAATGGVVSSYVLEAGVAPGNTVVSLPSTITSLTVPLAPPGTFYVRVRGVNSFGTGPASTEYVLRIDGDGGGALEAPGSAVAFMSGGRLTFTWAAPQAGGVPTGYVIEAGTATGLSNIAAIGVNTRSFTFSPVPDGFYFIRVRARRGASVGPASPETMIVIGNGPTPPGPPSFSTHTVTGSTVTLNWTAPGFGTPTSYIVEAGSATGLADLAVANTGNTNRTATFSGVPPGTYYVRLRAVNALGASIVSNERTVIVQ